LRKLVTDLLLEKMKLEEAAQEQSQYKTARPPKATRAIG